MEKKTKKQKQKTRVSLPHAVAMCQQKQTSKRETSEPRVNGGDDGSMVNMADS